MQGPVMKNTDFWAFRHWFNIRGRPAHLMPRTAGNAPKVVLFIGRFQPFHKGHEKILAYLFKRYSRVIIATRMSTTVVAVQSRRIQLS